MSSKRVSEMTDREIQEMAGAASGVVKVRVSGDAEDIKAMIEHITEAKNVTVLDRSRPRANRYDPGERVYLTVLVAGDGAR